MILDHNAGLLKIQPYEWDCSRDLDNEELRPLDNSSKENVSPYDQGASVSHFTRPNSVHRILYTDFKSNQIDVDRLH